MILSGTLLTPTGLPYANSSVRLTANNTSEDVLKFVTKEFKTDADGAYSIDVPDGFYSVNAYSIDYRSYISIGNISITPDTIQTTINELLMLGQTAGSDPLVEQVSADAASALASKNSAIVAATSASDSLAEVVNIQADVVSKESSVSTNAALVQASTNIVQAAEVNVISASESAGAVAHQYLNITDGLAGTVGTGSTNRFFTVPAQGESFVTQFRNDAGVATQIGEYANKTFVDSLNSFTRTSVKQSSSDGVLFVVSDSNNNETWLGANDVDGGPTPWAKQHLQNTLGIQLTEIPGYIAAVSDINGNLTDLCVDDITGQFPDFVIQRLATRLAPIIGGGGSTSYPKTAHNNLTNLPALRMKLGQIRAGDAAQLRIGVIGDSYTAGHLYYLNRLAYEMAKDFGFAGPGYIGFNHGAALGDTSFQYTRSSTTYFGGSWIVSELGTASPDNRTITAGAVGDYVSVNAIETATIPTLVTSGKLLYLGDNTSPTVRYRWGDALPWNTLTLTGTGVQPINFPVLPIGTAWKFRMEVVTGLPTLFGIYLSNSNTGVQFSKLAASGSSSVDWYHGSDSAWIAQWKASVALIPCDTYMIMLGGNDQSASVPPATYLANIQGIVANLKSINPAADIHITVRWDTIRASTYPMSAYADVVRTWAYENKIACSDMSYTLGNDLSLYASTGLLPLIGSDNTHPDPATGGRVITEFFYRAILAAQ